MHFLHPLHSFVSLEGAMKDRCFSLQTKKSFYLKVVFIFLCVLALNSGVPLVSKAGGTQPFTIVSIATDGTQGNSGSDFARISADGRYVAFRSWANNLVPGDTNNLRDIFVHDMQTGITTRASVDTSGIGGDGTEGSHSISADGRYVAYESWGAIGGEEIFVHDMQTGITTRASVDSNGFEGNDVSWLPSISANGRYVAFSSDATNLVAGDTNNLSDIFVHDMQTGITTLVSVDSNGVQGNGDVYSSSISGDGRYVAFMSYSTNLVLGGTSGPNIFVQDMLAGTTTLVSVDSNGNQANEGTPDAVISDNGRYVTFSTYASNLVPGDTNGLGDVFVHDMQTGITTRVSVDSNGSEGNGGSWDSFISADGRYVVFDSGANNLVPDDNNGTVDIFVHDMQIGITSLVSTGSNDLSYYPSISADGRYVAFESFASNLVSDDSNGKEDVFIRDLLGQCNLTIDSDCDGLLNDWELNGYDYNNDGVIDVDLPAMGADPDIKDIFVEIDYMVDHGEFIMGIWHRGHTHKPKASAIEAVVQTFNNQAGIHLHVDYGPDAPLTWGKTETWGNLSHGEELEEQKFLQPTNEIWDWSGFDHIKNIQGHFSQERTPIFHYAIFAHYLGGDVPLGTSGGTHTQGNDCPSFRLGASDFIVATGGAKNPEGTSLQQAGIFMHELGHNLGLCHGGDDNQLFEPNYLSVMNYSYQTYGLTIKQPDGIYQGGFLNYSIFGNVIPNLVETELNEQLGMGGSPPFDTYGISYFCRHQGIWEHKWITDTNQINWDCEDGYEANVVANINDGNKDSPNQDLTVLTGAYDDWAHLVYDGGLVGGDKTSNQSVEYLASDSQGQSTTIEELTFETAENLYRPYSIAIGSSYDLVISQGINTTFPITVTNTGALTATVTFSSTFGNDWFDLSSIPDILTLASGETISIPIGLIIPSSTSSGEMQQITINALLKESPLMGDSTTLKATVGPMAWFEAEPVIGNSPLIVSFRDISVGEYDSWLWDFGDGFQSVDRNPTHTYTKPGTYTVSLLVTGLNGSDIYERKDLITVRSYLVYLPILRK